MASIYDVTRINPMLRQIQEQNNQINRMLSASNIRALSDITKQVYSIYDSPAIKAFNEQAKQLNLILNSYGNIISESVSRLNMSMQPIVQAVQAYQNQFAQINETIARSIYPLSEQLHNIAMQTPDLSYILDELRKVDEGYEIEEINELTSDEQDEIISALQDIVSNPINWQEKCVKYIRKFNEKNPVISWIIANVIVPICVSIIATALMGQFNVKENPEASSKTIHEISYYQIVNIVGDAPYYYEVEFTNDDSKVVYRGWISKRKLNKVIQDLD